MNYRIEKDTLGEIQVANDKYWGAQKHSAHYRIFQIGPEASMPIEIIHGICLFEKRQAALTNNKSAVE